MDNLLLETSEKSLSESLSSSHFSPRALRKSNYSSSLSRHQILASSTSNHSTSSGGSTILTTTVNRRLRSSDNLSLQLCNLGKSIGLSVEIFATVGETIGDENPEIRGDMLHACSESRALGNDVEKYSGALGSLVLSCKGSVSHATSEAQFLHSLSASDFETLVRTLRLLLAGVTQILLLADKVVVTKLVILGKDERISPSLLHKISSSNSFKTMHHFTEFVKGFCDFGSEMEQLSKILGNDKTSDNEERRFSQIQSARHILHRSSRLLLTSSAVFQRYPESLSARENRDTVFCQMRRALDLIHYIIKEAIVEISQLFSESENSETSLESNEVSEKELFAQEVSVCKAILILQESVQIMRMTFVSESYKEMLRGALESIIERTQDFTYSAYTSHEHRQKVLLLCQRSTVELSHLLRMMQECTSVVVVSPIQVEFDENLRHLLNTTKELLNALRQTALEHSHSLLHNLRISSEILGNLKTAALSGDRDRIKMSSDLLLEQIDYIEDVAKLISHVSTTEDVAVRAKHAQINIHIYGPQVPVAASTLCSNPHSQSAVENYEAFSSMCLSLMNDVILISKSVADKGSLVLSNSQIPSRVLLGSSTLSYDEKCLHKSVPDLTISNGKVAPLEESFLNFPKEESSESRRHSTPGLPCGYRGGHLDPYFNPHAEYARPEDVLNAFKDVEKNEILNRSKKMTEISNDMINFTRGVGKVKTTQELFTSAEYFAEEANLLYKVLRVFSYDVPSGEDKRILMAIADNVPKHCHQLQMLIQSLTVGKAATFTKVDSIIKETRAIISLVVKIVNICHSNAERYNLDFSIVSSESRINNSEESSQSFGSSGPSASGNTSGSDSS